MNWTPELIKRLREMAESGMNYQKAAIELTRETKQTVTYSSLATAARNYFIKFQTAAMGKQPTEKWAPEIIETLKRLILEQYSGAQAADELTRLYSDKYTKNSVIAACRKHQIAMNGSKGPVVRKPVYKKPAIKVEKIIPIVTTIDEPEMLYVPLIYLKSNQCAFPVNGVKLEPCNAFCGHPVYGRSYCHYHFTKAFTKPKRVKAPKENNISVIPQVVL